MKRFAIASEQVVTPKGTRPAVVQILDGKIEKVTHKADLSESIQLIDYGNLVIAPGIVDSHVHINEPGRTDWEGFATATRAAAAGGITTLVDMPLNSSPVTIDLESFRMKLDAAADQCWVDVGFYAGLVPGNPQCLPELIDAGVLGVKCFLCDSGLEEFPATTPTELHAAMPILAQAKVPLLVHAELVDSNAPIPSDPTSFVQFVQSRPSRWEVNAIRMMIDFAKQYGCHVHIVHLATADDALLAEIAQAKLNGVPLTIETCPHYLHFAMESIPDAKPIYKCAPPIRSQANRDGLRNALFDGLIDTIGSDHSPCPAEMKYLDTGNIQMAWGGISGVQFSLPVVWTALQDTSIDFTTLFRWMSTNPAQLVGLSDRKGAIAQGLDADFVIWDPNYQSQVETSSIRHRNGISPYVGETLHGRIHHTYLRGELVFEDDIVNPTPHGRTLLR